MIQNPEVTLGKTQSSPAESGKEFAARSVYAQRNDCKRLTSDHVVLPSFTCAIPKEVLFLVLDKLCNTAKTNVVIKQMLDDFVKKVIKGSYSEQNNGK